MKQATMIGTAVGAGAIALGTLLFSMGGDAPTPASSPSSNPTKSPGVEARITENPGIDPDFLLCAKAEAGDTVDMQALLAAGADPRFVSCPDGQGPLLHTALRSEKASLALVRALVTAGADACGKDDSAVFPYDIVQTQSTKYSAEFQTSGLESAKEKQEAFSQISAYLEQFSCGQR